MECVFEMFNLIEEEIGNKSVTENNALGYESSKSALVDLNYLVSSLRNESENEIIRLFDKAFHENPEYCVKWLFYARDIREGLGERRLFRICYRRLVELDVDIFYKNLNIISEYGRWDDLISLLGISEVTDKRIVTIINSQLIKDLNNMGVGGSISLLGKWMPSENASSKKTKQLARKLCKLMEMGPRKYRLMLSKLRRYLDVVEVKMCDKRWSDIDYSAVPSLANLRYKNAFLRNDEERRKEFLESVSKGEVNFNMDVATPVDVVSRYVDKYYNICNYDETLELAWKNLKNVDVTDTMVVADGSGSMTIPVSGNITALEVAMALAIYTSEHNTGVYKDKYITFSYRPQFVDLSNDNDLSEKITHSMHHNECSNTNIEAVFDLILNIAIRNDVSNEDMIKNILIISDMEFDEAQTISWWGNTKSNPLTQTLFDDIKERFNRVGYDLPKLIFWNVNSRTHTIPLIENELGVTLVSGFSQNVLKMVMSNKYNPYDVLIETITSERYDLVKV